MISIDNDLVVYSKDAMHTLMHSQCPKNRGNPSSCVFHDIRRLELEERERWFSKLSREQIIQLYLQHTKCLNEG